MAQQVLPNYNYTGQSYNTAYPVPNNVSFQSWSAQNPYNKPQEPQPQQVKSQRVWVMDENSAKSYIVQNDTEQVLWDKDKPVIYIKTVDALGKPSIVTLDYTIREPKPEDDPDYETKALRSEINELKEMVKSLVSSQKTTYKNNYKKNGGEEQ